MVHISCMPEPLKKEEKEKIFFRLPPPPSMQIRYNRKKGRPCVAGFRTRGGGGGGETL